MKKIISFMVLLIACHVYGQDYRLKAGDAFPAIVLRPVINAPVKELDLNRYPAKKLFILNLWGTWCSPCIPEMDALAKLQIKYDSRIQIVGVSDDSRQRLEKYLARKPSKLWLASDTASLLYQMLNLASVGQSMVLDAHRQIVAVVKTDSVNSRLIDRLLAGKPVASNAEIKQKKNVSNADDFGVDTALSQSFTIRSYMVGQSSMGRTPNQGPYAHRRVTFYNVGLVNLYRNAYNINSGKQIVYECDRKKYNNYDDKSTLYCLDLLVKPEQKDSLSFIFQKKLQESVPLKGRTEMRTMPVYVLQTKPGATLQLTESAPGVPVRNFSGLGYDGKNVTVGEFANEYLNNELKLPVVDETGLTKLYDIKTHNDMSDETSVKASVEVLGLQLVKAERPVKVLVLYDGSVK